MVWAQAQTRARFFLVSPHQSTAEQIVLSTAAQQIHASLQYCARGNEEDRAPVYCTLCLSQNNIATSTDLQKY